VFVDAVRGGHRRPARFPYTTLFRSVDLAVGLDGEGPVDGVLDVLGGDRVPVRELQALAQGAAVALVAGVGETARLGRLRHGLAGPARLDHQRLHGLAQDVPGADVVGGGGVDRRRVVLRGGEPVRGADHDGVAVAAAAVGVATAGE